MNRLVAVLFVVAGTGCCFNICAPAKLESAVDAPITLEAVKARAAPPGVVVTVNRVTRSSGGGGACGHSPLCVILLPMMAWEALFPEQYDEAVIVDAGVEVYRGAFDTSGDFLQARVTKDGTFRDLRQLRLNHLHRRVVVEIAGGAVGGEAQPRLINPQIDLIGAYRQRLTELRDGSTRGQLLAEALQWLDQEAVPLVVEFAGSAAESDDTKAEIALSLCQVTANKTASFDPVMTALSTSPGPLTAAAALACTTSDLPSQEPRLALSAARPFVDVVVGAICNDTATTPAFRAFDALKKRSVDEQQAVSAAVAACSNVGARVFMNVGLGVDVNEADLTAAVATPYGPRLLAQLDERNDMHRAVAVKALANDATAHPAMEALSSMASAKPLSSAANVAVAHRVVSRFDGSLCGPDEDRARALAVLDAGRRSGADLVAARAALKSARKTVAKDDAAFVEAGLLVSGADADVDAAVLTAPLGTTTPWREKPFLVCHRDGVITFALILRGCSSTDLSALQQKSLACVTND